MKGFLAKVAIITLVVSLDANGFTVPKGRVSSNYDRRAQWSLSSSVQPAEASQKLGTKLEEAFRREEQVKKEILLPLLKELYPTKEKLGAISVALSKSRHLNFLDIFITVTIGWCLVPVANFITLHALQSEEGVGLLGFKEYPVVETISNYFKFDACVYIAHFLVIASDAYGFKMLKRINFAYLVSRVGRTLWAMDILKKIKKLCISAFCEKYLNAEEMITVYDRITNIFLYFVTAAIIAQILSVNIGIAISSVLSLGGLGTIILSLASKSVAEQLVSGIGLSTSGQFVEGEKIKLGDGTKGRIFKIGVTHVELRLSDETIVRIPNSQIFDQRIVNLSRMHRNQVKQTLRFRYEDIDKMPIVTEEIKAEIMASCPKLIKMNRPFRVHWRGIEKDHLEVVVDCRFNIPPTGTARWDNRQEVLEAIYRAVKRCGVEFARPSFSVESDCKVAEER
mmetsp:Transcript_28343/g.42372  ORF Transcript_28343/g.42372 Transcript_28343/m.42372 type:complete len:452 (+) Transcript_28343:44-1399(+)